MLGTGEVWSTLRNGLPASQQHDGSSPEAVMRQTDDSAKSTHTRRFSRRLGTARSGPNRNSQSASVAPFSATFRTTFNNVPFSVAPHPLTSTPFVFGPKREISSAEPFEQGGWKVPNTPYETFHKVTSADRPNWLQTLLARQPCITKRRWQVSASHASRNQPLGSAQRA